MKKRVYIIYTGGTIGMRPTPEGYAPAPGYLAAQIMAMPELANNIMPEVDIQEYDPLLDSANMTPDDWHKIARDIGAHYREYDGFIILHGTDTMAYTASALSFMLQGLRKPVILTGSQIPLCEVRNDARANIITALVVAANFAIPEVCLCFGDQLLRGCRSVKVSADGLDAFASPNLPALGEIGVDIRINWELTQPAPPEESALQVHELSPVSIGALPLWPGISAQVVRNFLQPPLKGLLLKAYGVGNGPTNNQDFLAALEEATARGVVIVDCTQCLKGSVHLGDYATGSALAKAGVISGFDMTAEAALAKLAYLFSQDLNVDEVRRLMQTNLRGELTAKKQDRL
jgi:L-asparaginase